LATLVLSIVVFCVVLINPLRWCFS